MKKFYTISPFQPSDRMTEGVEYIPDNNPDLKFGKTSFPIIPVINAYAEKNEKIEIISVISNYGNAKENQKLFIKEVDKLAEEKGFKYNITPINIDYNDNIDTQIDLFAQLIDTTNDEDQIYADITYGSKVMSQILSMGINYSYRLHKNVTLGCIVYGKADHQNNTYTIYDETSMNYMDEIVRVLAETKISNPAKHIKALLNQ